MELSVDRDCHGHSPETTTSCPHLKDDFLDSHKLISFNALCITIFLQMFRQRNGAQLLSTFYYMLDVLLNMNRY